MSKEHKHESKKEEESPNPPALEKLRRFPGDGDPIVREFEEHPGLYVEKKKEDKAPHAEGKDAEDERNKKREAKDDKPPAKGKHDV